MKNIKYIIYGLIIIIAILIIIILNFNRIQEDNNDVGDSIVEEETELIDLEENIQFSKYSVIKDCIQKYIDLLDINNSIYYEKQEDGTDKYNANIQSETIYSVLDERFIIDNNLNKNNILNKIQVLSKKQIFYPIKIDIVNDSDISVYKVYGIMQELEYLNPKEVYYIVFIDENEETFSIIPIDSKVYSSYTFNENIDIIKYKEYNTYSSLSSIQEEEIAIEYFERYKFLTLANPKYTYEKMSEEYRKKRFGTVENYIQYIKDNYNEFKNLTPKRYLTNINGEYIQYVIQDQNQNYYIFDTTDALNYNVSLDTYTINTEKFKTTYENSSNQKKVQMNIDKFFQMINRQDYRTSYNCLAESFKSSRIKTQVDFELIAKNRFFKYNTISFESFKDLGSNTYSYLVKLKDFTGEKTNEISMNVIMKLAEGTDFVMSFSFN